MKRRLHLAATALGAVLTSSPAIAQPGGGDFLTLFGGSGRDVVYDSAVDAAGNTYVVGETNSTIFPVAGGVQSTLKGPLDGFVVKLNPNGSLLYATYLGGSGFDSIQNVAVDAAGNAWVTGATTSNDFPRVNAIDNTVNASDAFILQLNPQGNTILFSTYLGGSSQDAGQAIAVDSQDKVYVTGRTLGGLTPINAAQSTFGGTEDAFVAKLDPTTSTYLYLTYVGGNFQDTPVEIDVDATGRACIVGYTESTNLPLVNAPQTVRGALGEVFYSMIDPTGQTFVVTSYLGGNRNEFGAGISCTTTKLAVVGQTNSTDFPTGTTSGAPVQSELAGTTDAFLAAFALNNTLVTPAFTTLYGGRRTDIASDVHITSDDRVVVMGDTKSSGLPEIGGTPSGLHGAGVFKTTDNGQTWQRVGLPGTSINQMATVPTVPVLYLAASDLGLRKSSDGGVTWQAVGTGLPSRVVHSVVVDPSDSCTWYIGVDSVPSDGATPVGGGKTTNCGEDWSIWGNGVERILSLDTLDDPNRLVATVDKPGSPGEICMVDTAGTEVGCFFGGETGYVVAVDPSAPCRFYVGTQSGTVSQTSGCSFPFSEVNTNATFGSPVTGLAVNTAGTALFAGTADGKVWKKVGNDPWSQVTTFTNSVGLVAARDLTSFYVSYGDKFTICNTDASGCTPPATTGASQLSSLEVDGSTFLAGAGNARDLWTLRFGTSWQREDARYVGCNKSEEAADATWLEAGLNTEHIVFSATTDGPCESGSGMTIVGSGGAQDAVVGSVGRTSGPPPCAATVQNLETLPQLSANPSGAIVNFSNVGTCDVTPVSNDSWITIGKFNGAAGAANWVDILTAENTGPPRTGTVRIGDQVLIIMQDGVPEPGAPQVLHTSTTRFNADGGFGSATVYVSSAATVAVEVDPAAQSWLSVVDRGQLPNGAGTTLYLVDENTSPTSRTGTITFRNAFGVDTVTIIQDGAQPRCATPPTTSTVSVPADGQTVSLPVSAPAGCQHTSQEGSTFIGALQFTPGPVSVGGIAQATGPGTVSFVVAENPGPGRVASVDVAGYPVTLIQGAGDAAITDRSFLAEGATGSFFDLRVAIANPSPTFAIVATARFDTSQGQSFEQSVLLPPLARATIDPATIAGLADAELSTSIAADGDFVAARLMQWDASGYGSHAESGVGSAATTWYLAEGATHSFFDLFYLLQNPGDVDANVEVRYLKPAPQTPTVKQYTVPAHQRFNIWVNQEGPDLASTDVSAVVTSLNSQPIVVERAMYRSTQGRLFNAGHQSAGVTTPTTQWFLAEGATGPFFDLFILVANATAQDAPIAVQYLLTNGTVIDKTYVVSANSRFNIWVDIEGPQLADAALSATVTSTAGVPIVVERAMWWPGSADSWHEAHNSAGTTTTGTRWSVAEGEVGGTASVETYILIANTSAFQGQARVTLMFEDGDPVAREFAVAPTSRFNVAIATDFPEAAGKRFAVLVESLGETPAQLVVEEAIYSNSGGVIWAAGSNLLATRLQ